MLISDLLRKGGAYREQCKNLIYDKQTGQVCSLGAIVMGARDAGLVPEDEDAD